MALRTATKIASIHDDDSSSSDDGLLDYHPFSGEEENKLRKEKTSSRKTVSPSTTSTKRPARRHDREEDVAVEVRREDTNRATKRQMRHRRRQSDASEDDDIVAEVAARKAARAILPSGITHADQLVWYKEFKDFSVRYYPSRICDPTEAVGLRTLPESWDRTKKALIQFLEYPVTTSKTGGFNQRVVRKDTLIPFYGNGPKPNRTKGSSSLSWSEELWEKYQKQQKIEARKNLTSVCKSDLEANRLFLDRILKHVLEEEGMLAESVAAAHNDVDQDSDDLEEPYSQNLSPPGSDSEDDGGILNTSEKKREPIRPGDVVEYCHPIFVAGDKRGIRTAKVLSTDPNRSPILVLENGDHLPSDLLVKRVRVKTKDALHEHPGVFRPIYCFKVEKRALSNDDKGVVAGFRKESERIGGILEKNMSKFREAVKGDGFAPMDMLHNFKGTKKGACSRKSPVDNSASARKGGTVVMRQSAVRSSRLSPDIPSDSDSCDDLSRNNNKDEPFHEKNRSGGVDMCDSDSSVEMFDSLAASQSPRKPSRQKMSSPKNDLRQNRIRKDETAAPADSSDASDSETSWKLPDSKAKRKVQAKAASRKRALPGYAPLVTYSTRKAVSGLDEKKRGNNVARQSGQRGLPTRSSPAVTAARKHIGRRAGLSSGGTSATPPVACSSRSAGVGLSLSKHNVKKQTVTPGRTGGGPKARIKKPKSLLTKWMESQSGESSDSDNSAKNVRDNKRKDPEVVEVRAVETIDPNNTKDNHRPSRRKDRIIGNADRYKFSDSDDSINVGQSGKQTKEPLTVLDFNGDDLDDSDESLENHRVNKPKKRLSHKPPSPIRRSQSTISSVEKESADSFTSPKPVASSGRANFLDSCKISSSGRKRTKAYGRRANKGSASGSTKTQLGLSKHQRSSGTPAVVVVPGRTFS